MATTSRAPRALQCLHRLVFRSIRRRALLLSDTPLAKLVTSPKLVKDLDWLNWCWPQENKTKGKYPKVYLKVLYSMLLRIIPSKIEAVRCARLGDSDRANHLDDVNCLW